MCRQFSNSLHSHWRWVLLREFDRDVCRAFRRKPPESSHFTGLTNKCLVAGKLILLSSSWLSRRPQREPPESLDNLLTRRSNPTMNKKCSPCGFINFATAEQ